MSYQNKQRHGCLTAWLIIMIINDSLAALGYLLAPQEIRQALPNAPDWVFPVITISCLISVVCAIALFRWKKWGFYGLVGSSIAVFTSNIAIGCGISSLLYDFLDIIILYGVLHIGKENKGWPQLE